MRDAKGCYVRAESCPVSKLGANDLMVVETDAAVLVADKSRSQEVKEVVKTPLFLIGVQSAGYLGEGDIVRLEDRYKRE